MSQRSPRAEADLIISQLKGMLDTYSWNLEPHEAMRYNALIRRMEHLLSDSFPQLLLDSYDRFEDPAKRGAMQFRLTAFRSKGKAALDYLLASQSRPAPVLEERYEVLATLIDAYLRDTSLFHGRWFAGNPNPTITHPGLDRPYEPAWSHVEALAREDLIDLRKDQYRWTIGIPSHVLAEYSRGAGIELLQPAGSRRIEAIKQSPTTSYYITHVSGGQANVQNASRGRVRPRMSASHQETARP